jgi:hypothetical protein
MRDQELVLLWKVNQNIYEFTSNKSYCVLYLHSWDLGVWEWDAEEDWNWCIPIAPLSVICFIKLHDSIAVKHFCLNILEPSACIEYNNFNWKIIVQTV